MSLTSATAAAVVSACAMRSPTLFDLVDESDTLEVDGVAKEDYGKVVEHCYLCDLCYMTEVPLRASPRVERRFPPPHAARQGG